MFLVHGIEDKILEKEFDSIFLVDICLAFYSVIQKHIKRSLTKLQTRSILSAINATSYLLAKNLNPTLSSVTTNK